MSATQMPVRNCLGSFSGFYQGMLPVDDIARVDRADIIGFEAKAPFQTSHDAAPG
ncbi:hypothetical protein [Mesorhizobium sp. CO1-1-8]|uniref:hypothetical protein n=1 Tax=Mesorhizobium sp. CO1-1-8 TaxID=2876631 RepID=UPI001CD0D31F|nr:hypothetical protein [Mesorhizobium sp. CO1-1-8]MBZ9772892.1 hypothetical protein [Mesorhizobium sp. CO1-1-8]